MGPKVSIITIALNSETHIEQTITSVVRQSYPNLEYIVIDGGSTDRTLDIVKRHENKMACWVSEPDCGIADAMNRGLARASGEFVIFLHSDDYLLDDNVVEWTAAHLNGEYELYLSDIYLSGPRQIVRRRPRGFTWWMNVKTGVFHQSAVCAKALFNRIGGFDDSFRIAMDYDFFLRAYRADAKAVRLSNALSVMRLNGISSRTDRQGLSQRLSEEKKIHEKNCQSPQMKLFYGLYWAIYPRYKFLNMGTTETMQ